MVTEYWVWKSEWSSMSPGFIIFSKKNKINLSNVIRAKIMVRLMPEIWGNNNSKSAPLFFIFTWKDSVEIKGQ